MDVRLPDGTLIQGVPEGTTKAQLIEKLQAKGFDVSGLVDQAAKKELSEPVTVGGVLSEGAKGLLRGAGNTARMIPETLLPVAKPVIEALSAPSQRMVTPAPQNTAEQMASTGGEIAGAVAAGGGLAGGARQSAVNVLGPAVGGAVGEQVAGEGGKIAGSLVVPTAQIASAGVSAARANLAERVQKNVEQFKQAGAGTPSVGQATEANFFQGLENLLSKFPGGQGIFRKFAEKQQAGMGETARTGVSAEGAGLSIERGIKGEGGFIERTKQVWNKLDDAVAEKIPAGSTFAPSKTAEALDKLTTPVKGAERSTGTPLDARVIKIKEDLAADLEANNGQIPYEAMRVIRSRIGTSMEDALVSGAKSGEMKKLYGAITQDLETAAKEAGAGKEFARQNEYYKARMDRIENTLDRVIGNTPEDTFKKFMPTNPDQVNTVRRVMRSLDPEQRQIVQEAVVNRLGRASSGKQDASGELFSPETFLTNWNRMSPGAKTQIFSDPSVRKNMDALASVAGNIREGAKVFANPSGTAGATMPYGIGYMIGAGNIATAGTLAGGAAIGSKMLTSPKVIEWLAQAPKVTEGQMAGHIARLGVIYNATKDPELKQELSTYINSVSPAAKSNLPPPMIGVRG